MLIHNAYLICVHYSGKFVSDNYQGFSLHQLRNSSLHFFLIFWITERWWQPENIMS